MTTSRPVPVPDERSRPFWEAAADHRLVLGKCGRCGKFTHPPGVVCPNCQHTDPRFEFEPVRETGVVRSWTVVHQSFLPGFDADVPFVLADVEIDDADGVRLIGRLVDGPSAALHAGATVTVAWEDFAPDVSVVAFALRP